jgi:hypothetical protein
MLAFNDIEYNQVGILSLLSLRISSYCAGSRLKAGKAQDRVKLMIRGVSLFQANKGEP